MRAEAKQKFKRLCNIRKVPALKALKLL